MWKLVSTMRETKKVKTIRTSDDYFSLIRSLIKLASDQNERHLIVVFKENGFDVLHPQTGHVSKAFRIIERKAHPHE